MNEEENTTEVRTTEVQDGATNVQRQTVASRSTPGGGLIAKRVVWYLAGIIITFLLLRFVLLMLGAQQGNMFVDFVYAVGGFFSMPFNGIFGEPSYGSSYFDLSSLVGAIVYGLVAWGIAKAFTVTSTREA